MKHCRECRGNLVLNRNNEVVCSHCGLLHRHGRISELSYYTKNRKFSGGFVYKGWNMGSTLKPSMGRRWIDTPQTGYRFQRLRLIHFYSKMFHKRSMHYRVSKTMDLVASRLNLNRAVKDYAYGLYVRTVSSIVDPRPNHFRVAAACLFVAARRHGYNIPMKKIVKTFKGLRHNVSTSNVMKTLFMLKKRGHYIPGIDWSDRVKTLIKRISFHKEFLKRYRTLHLNNDQNLLFLKRGLLQRSLNIIESIDKRLVQGHHPTIVASAAIYLASIQLMKKKSKKIISQELLSEISGFSVSALRTNYKLLSRGVDKSFQQPIDPAMIR